MIYRPVKPNLICVWTVVCQKGHSHKNIFISISSFLFFLPFSGKATHLFLSHCRLNKEQFELINVSIEYNACTCEPSVDDRSLCNQSGEAVITFPLQKIVFDGSVEINPTTDDGSVSLSKTRCFVGKEKQNFSMYITFTFFFFFEYSHHHEPAVGTTHRLSNELFEKDDSCEDEDLTQNFHFQRTPFCPKLWPIGARPFGFARRKVGSVWIG